MKINNFSPALTILDVDPKMELLDSTSKSGYMSGDMASIGGR